MNCIVEAPAAVDVFEIVNELPPLFKPSMVTLLAPFKFINVVALLPVSVAGIPLAGSIVNV